MTNPPANEQPASAPAPNSEASAPAPSSESSSSSSSLVCQWVGCGEPFPTAETLYDHVCERHVGRKSTNNLNLTCAWGNCHTTTVKRDHITSHIRVHVPLKPHKCDLCGKSFKRPQDLKKHVKTHAEDPQNAAMRAHDGARGQPPNGYGQMNGQSRLGGYPGAYPGIQADHSVGYAYSQGPSMGHYAPTAHGGPAAHYGQVYYPAPTGITNHSYDRKGAFTAMDQLFGNIRNKSFDPANYNEVSHQLLGLQGSQLPLPLGGEYGPQVSNGGGVYGPTAIATQNLPSFSNLRTKNDLAFVEDYLNRMTQTAYESSGAVPVSMLGPAGRQSHSPPALSSSHSTSEESYGGSTPAMTPGSSAVSYTSGHSPTSVHSNLVSPSTGGNPAYPSLPNVSASPSQGMAPVSTLGSSYNADPRRRNSGSYLRRAAPADTSMEVDTARAEASGSRKAKAKAADANIDPALSGETADDDEAASDGTATPGGQEAADRDEQWVENMRLLEKLRDFVRAKLDAGEFDDEDTAMGGSDDDAAKPAESKAEDDESKLDPSIVSYPQLKAE